MPHAAPECPRRGVVRAVSALARRSFDACRHLAPVLGVVVVALRPRDAAVVFERPYFVAGEVHRATPFRPGRCFVRVQCQWNVARFAVGPGTIESIVTRMSGNAATAGPRPALAERKVSQRLRAARDIPVARVGSKPVPGFA